MGTDGVTFDAKFAAYEKYLKANAEKLGLKGQQIGEQLGRYSEGLQHDQTKASKKLFGKQFAELKAKEKIAKGTNVGEFTKFLKGKKGKWAIAGAAIAAVGVGLYGLFKSNKDNDKSNDAISGADKPSNKALEQLIEEIEKSKQVKEAPVAEIPTEYTVKKGDCVWNIAKAHLKELNKDVEGYKPTDREILVHTKELMQINNLKFEPNNYHVMIRPDDKLKLVA